LNNVERGPTEPLSLPTSSFLLIPPSPLGIYNPYSESDVKRIWGEVQEAERAGDYMKRVNITLENIAQDDRIIWLKPVLHPPLPPSLPPPPPPLRCPSPHHHFMSLGRDDSRPYE